MPYDQPLALVLCFLFITPIELPARQMPGQPAVNLAQATKPTDAPTQPAGSASQTRPVNSSLKILVLEGQNVLNSLSSSSSIDPVVKVLDATEQPVAGAAVTFEVSPAGPGGSFNNAPIATTKTDYSGQATAHFTPNKIAGAFTIKVTASIGGQTAETRIHQSNDAKVADAMLAVPPKPWYKNWKWWAIIGAGAGAGVAATVILINRDQTSTITIAPGGVVIGGPR